jgi:hypothetical protein
LEHEKELARVSTKEEATQLMDKHRDDLLRLDDTLANEQKRQMEAMRERLSVRNNANATQRIQRQIRMAEVQKRKAEQQAATVFLGVEEEKIHSKEDLDKCLSKVTHMRKVIFKGGFSKTPTTK